MTDIYDDDDDDEEDLGEILRYGFMSSFHEAAWNRTVNLTTISL